MYSEVMLEVSEHENLAVQLGSFSNILQKCISKLATVVKGDQKAPFSVVSRDGSRRRGGGNDTPPPVELTLSRSQKVTVRRECGSRRCSHLSDLGSPDIGRGKRK